MKVKGKPDRRDKRDKRKRKDKRRSTRVKKVVFGLNNGQHGFGPAVAPRVEKLPTY